MAKGGRLRIRRGPDGVHLFDRRTGLNILVDELVPEPRAWSFAPRQVAIALTNACDLRCAFCYAPKSRAVLDSERVCEWLDELDAGGCLGVGFGGGEPTLHRGLARICAHGASRTGLAITMTSHAHRFTDELIDYLDGNLHFLRVSVDAVEGRYEKIRGRPYIQIVKQLTKLCVRFRVGINTVVNSDTIRDLQHVAQLASDVGAEELLLLPEQPTGARRGIDVATVADLRQWVDGYTGRLRLAVSSGGAEGLPVADPLPLETGLRAYAHIDARGTVKRSSFHTDGVAVGADGVTAALCALEALDSSQSTVVARFRDA